MPEIADGGDVEGFRGVAEPDECETHKSLQTSTEGRNAGYQRHSSRSVRRLRHGVTLTAASLAFGGAVSGLVDQRDARSTASVASAYASMFLIALTIALGPIRRLRGRRVPMSFDLRRDAGIIASVMIAVHILAAFGNHFSGVVRRYFVADTGEWRLDEFGLMVWTGIAATAVAVTLLASSNDVSVRGLGKKWKVLQRAVHVLVIGAIGHELLAAHLLRRRPALLVVPVIAFCTVYLLRFLTADGRRMLHGAQGFGNPFLRQDFQNKSAVSGSEQNVDS